MTDTSRTSSQTPSIPDRVQVLVLGAGPGGYSCALRLAELGLDVMLVEPGRAGGTCLHAGCIPSKALIHAADVFRSNVRSSSHPDANDPESTLVKMGIACKEVTLDWHQTQSWKAEVVDSLAQGVDGLLTTAGVKSIRGRGQMLDGKRVLVVPDNGADPVEVQAQQVVLAVGSREVSLPSLPASDSVLYAADALAIADLPEHLAVVGGGYIGLELGQAFARFGVKVSIIEAQDRLLPAYPKSLVAPLLKALAQDDIQTHTASLAHSFGDGYLRIVDQDKQEQEQLIRADKVLVAVGRQANLEGWGREHLALDLADGFIAVDRRGETSMSGVFAVGDVTGEPMLAHRAIAQGRVVAEVIAGRRREFAPVAIPAVCFTAPEILSVGLTADEAKAAGRGVLVKRFPLAANGRSLTLGNPTGFVEVIADSSDHVLLGVQAVGEHVAELVHSFTLALEMGAQLEDVADTVHAHPTIGESFAEVSQAALGFK